MGERKSLDNILFSLVMTVLIMLLIALLALFNLWIIVTFEWWAIPVILGLWFIGSKIYQKVMSDIQ